MHISIQATLLLVFGALLSVLSGNGRAGAAENAPTKASTVWFREARYGLFVHFLPSGEGFQKEVDAFNVHTFAQDCHRAGVGYVIWTLGQNSGYFCAPNAVYDRYAGRKAGQTCSTRDLPMELADALGRQGIKLMLYAPGDVPAFDDAAAKGIGAVHFIRDSNGENWQFNDEMVRHWAEVLQEWAARYGDKVAGWWLDGCYRESGFTDAHAQILSQAVKRGNPNSLVAANPGVVTNPGVKSKKVYAAQDYLAGENDDLLNGKCDRPFVDGVQWHQLSFLGSGWSSGPPRCTAQQLIAFLKENVNAHGGVLTLDVPLKSGGSGSIDPAHLAILEAVKAALQSGAH